jgi:hypothetical protein
MAHKLVFAAILLLCIAETIEARCEDARRKISTTRFQAMFMMFP